MKKLTAREIIDNILTANGLDQNELAMKSGIIPNTLVKAISRDVLTDEIVMKIHDSFGVRKEFLKTGEGEIFDKNPTPAINGSDKMQNEKLDLLIELSKTEYVIVPRVALQGSTLVSVDQIDNNKELLKWFVARTEQLQDELRQYKAEAERLRTAATQKAK